MTRKAYAASVRTARTCFTGAQNAGRMASYYRAEQMGIEVEKEWIATLDSRTRESHIRADGERVKYDELFSTGLRYPGDPNGQDASEIYNCRCTMRAIIPGVNDSKRISQNSDTNSMMFTSSENDGIMSFQRWYDLKRKSDSELVVKDVVENLKKLKPDYIEPKKHLKQPTEEEIIKNIGEYDEHGACTTQALAYIGNLKGYNVKDMCEDEAWKYISTREAVDAISRFPGVKSIKETGYDEFKTTKKLLQKIESGESYLMSTAEHSAIIKKDGDKLMFLELQGKRVNGWIKFDKDLDITLKKRFGCREHRTDEYGTSIVLSSYLMNLQSLIECKDLMEVIKYVNTV